MWQIQKVNHHFPTINANTLLAQSLGRTHRAQRQEQAWRRVMQPSPQECVSFLPCPNFTLHFFLSLSWHSKRAPKDMVCPLCNLQVYIKGQRLAVFLFKKFNLRKFRVETAHPFQFHYLRNSSYVFIQKLHFFNPLSLFTQFPANTQYISCLD